MHVSAMPCGQLALSKICAPDVGLVSAVEFRKAGGSQRSVELVLLLKKILVSRQVHCSREGVQSYGRWMQFESGISVAVAVGIFGSVARAGWRASLPRSGAVWLLVLARWGLGRELALGSVTGSVVRSSLADQLWTASVQSGPSAIPTSHLQGPECWAMTRETRQYQSHRRVYLPSYG